MLIGNSGLFRTKVVLVVSRLFLVILKCEYKSNTITPETM